MDLDMVRRELDSLVRHGPEMARVARVLGPVLVELAVQVMRNTAQVEENMQRLDKLEDWAGGPR